MTRGGPQPGDPWYARVVFRALDGWDTWARCVLGAVLLILVVGLAAGLVVAVVTHLAVPPAAAGLGAGGLAALSAATAVWRRRRR